MIMNTIISITFVSTQGACSLRVCTESMYLERYIKVNSELPEAIW